MKGIKFFGILAAASLLFSVNAFAQENNNRDENGNVVKGPYVTNNSFMDNTFVGAGLGVNFAMQDLFQFRGIGIAADLNFGKWFTPAIGLRAGLSGVNAVYHEDAAANNHSRQILLHADVLWDVINTFDGYKETRFWNIAPYFTVGVINNNVANFEYIAGFGLYNTFRISDKTDFTFDLRGLVGKESWFTHNSGRFFFPMSATVGLAFNLGKTNFNRLASVMPVVIPVPFTTEQYNALEDKVKALEAENSELKDKIAALEDENAKLKNMLTDENDYVYEDGEFKKVAKAVATPATVYFNIDSAVISAREKAHLEFYAENLEENAQLLLVGSADKETGTAEYNQKLSEKRAEAVKKYFVSKGINADNIETRGEGSSNNVYNTPAKNRACTIKIK